MESYLAMLGGLLCTGAFPATSTALAERAIIAMERQQLGEAKVLAEQALTILSAEHLDDYIMSPLIHTRGRPGGPAPRRPPGAREHLVQAARLRPLLTYAVSS
jgi:hypothetical protein